MTRPALEIRDLSISFGGMKALDRVSLRLEECELRCLIGPNGAGKSTLFKCLTGLQPADAGTIFLRGQDVTTAQPHVIAQNGVGIKTQVPSVMEALTVYEHIWLAACRVCTAEQSAVRTLQWLEKMGIADIAQKELADLSHGKRQLVELAMVMAQEPWLLLLDEPAAGMTDAEAAQLGDLIIEINQRACVIVVEHNMHFIRRIASRLTVLHKGRILRDGLADEVLADAEVRLVYLGGGAS